MTFFRRRRPWLPVAVAGAAALLVAILGGAATDVGPWYQSLAKPDWQPPEWAFGPAWTLIYALTALSAVAGWRGIRKRWQREWMVGLFCLNGALNVFWSVLFFSLKRPDWALYEVLSLWASVLVLIVFLWPHRVSAAALLVPYLLWVSFAGWLNYTVVAMNAPFGA
ncbi:MAG: TspO/MBR family protein [Minwuia sp.]|uniref:TspO/MBR family protein n=1 Tax=Minwuia sp. TaxID=2493630 RepID=UPI003A856A24